MDVLDLPPYEQLSLSLRRVVDALIEGTSPTPDALAALSSEENAQVQALLRIARLTALTLNTPEPEEKSQEAALRRAQTALGTRSPGPASPADTPPARRTLSDLLRGLRRNSQADAEDTETKP